MTQWIGAGASLTQAQNKTKQHQERGQGRAMLVITSRLGHRVHRRPNFRKVVSGKLSTRNGIKEINHLDHWSDGVYVEVACFAFDSFREIGFGGGVPSHEILNFRKARRTKQFSCWNPTVAIKKRNRGGQWRVLRESFPGLTGTVMACSSSSSAPSAPVWRFSSCTPIPCRQSASKNPRC